LHLHLEAYEHTNVMHIEITPEGATKKTYVCCGFLHEIQHLKRLEIDGIQFPLQFVTIFKKQLENENGAALASCTVCPFLRGEFSCS